MYQINSASILTEIVQKIHFFNEIYCLIFTQPNNKSKRQTISLLHILQIYMIFHLYSKQIVRPLFLKKVPPEKECNQQRYIM
jgi:hypothetical protein